MSEYIYHYTRISRLAKILREGRLRASSMSYIGFSKDDELIDSLYQALIKDSKSNFSHLTLNEIALVFNVKDFPKKDLHIVNYDNPSIYLGEDDLIAYIENGFITEKQYNLAEITQILDDFRIEQEVIYLGKELPLTNLKEIIYFGNPDKFINKRLYSELERICMDYNIKIKIRTY